MGGIVRQPGPDASGFTPGVDRIGTPPEMLLWGRIGIEWKRSSFSNGSGGNNCVEARRSRVDDYVLVRNSRDPHGGVLAFTADEWTAFLDGARAGEFNL